MRHLTLLALLLPLAACDKTPPSDPAPSQPPADDAKGAQEPPPADDDGASFASPPSSGENPEQPAEEPAADPELDKRIKETFGERCKLVRECGDMLGIDCVSAADGPYYFVKKGSLEKISTCGGACMGGNCTNCPPEGWTCEQY